MTSNIITDWNSYRGIKYFMLFEIKHEPFVPDTEFNIEKGGFDYLAYKIWTDKDTNNIIKGNVSITYSDYNGKIEIDENPTVCYDDDSYFNLINDLKTIFPSHFRLVDFGHLFDHFNFTLNKLSNVRD